MDKAIRKLEQNFRSEFQNLFTDKVNKIYLSKNDDTRL